MNNKKNYKKGYKNEIIQLLYLCGIIPYRSLRLLAVRPQLYQNAVKDLAEENIVIIDKKGGERNIRLLDRRKNREIYEPYIPTEYIEYYENEVRYVLRRLGEKDYTSAKKEFRNSDTKIFMYAAGVDISPDKNNKLISQCDRASYYGSAEVKSLINYNVITEKRDNEISKKVINSRINGVVFSEGGIYAVYNIGKDIIEWKRKGELRIAASIIAFARNKQYENITQKEAIIIAQTPVQYIKICTNTNEKRYKTTYINIDYTYDKVYAISNSLEGIKMLTIMTTKNWRQKMLDSILTPTEQLAAKNINVDCDGYDENTDIYKLIFCIPDLCKLKNFVKRAQIEDSKKRFKIFCFTSQIPVVVGLASDFVSVSSVNFDKYVNQYFCQYDSN